MRGRLIIVRQCSGDTAVARARCTLAESSRMLGHQCSARQAESHRRLRTTTIKSRSTRKDERKKLGCDRQIVSGQAPGAVSPKFRGERLVTDFGASPSAIPNHTIGIVRSCNVGTRQKTNTKAHDFGDSKPAPMSRGHRCRRDVVFRFGGRHPTHNGTNFEDCAEPSAAPRGAPRSMGNPEDGRRFAVGVS